MSSLSRTDGVVRVVFVTMDFKSLDYIVHYGAPRLLEDYIQESGRAGRDHQQSVSRKFTGNQVKLLCMLTKVFTIIRN